MRPFKMFFGIAVAVMLFLFVARIFFFAFIIAAVMSLFYALFRRIKDFISYDRYGNAYMPEYSSQRMNINSNPVIEPLFQEQFRRSHTTMNKVHHIHAI